MMSAAIQIVTLIETLSLVFCFAGILFHNLRRTGRARKGVLLLIVLVSWQAWAIPIGILCFPVVAAVLFVVVWVAELAVRSSVIATLGRTLKHCHSCEGTSVYNRINDHANVCQTRAQRRALRKSLKKLRKKGLRAERQAENTHRKYCIAFIMIDVVGVYVQVMSLICFLVVLRALIMIAIFVETVVVCGCIVRCFCVIWPPAVWIQTSCRLLEMTCWPVEAVVARLPVLGLPCCSPLVESMLRTCFWCVLMRGCALGDVAATGTCILRMLALHGSTAASCRAFSMLVMLGLDERSFSLEGKVLLCAAVAMAPLFPPRRASADYMREVREFRAQHGSEPVETPDSAGYALATRIRKARAKGVFNAAELAELDSEIPAPAAAQKNPAGACHPCPGCRRNRRADHPEHTRVDGCRFPDVEPVVWNCPGCARNRPAEHPEHTHVDGECRVPQQRVRSSGSRAKAGAQPRSALARATPAGSAFSSALGGSSSGSDARSSPDIARPSDPLIVEATEPQVPDPEIDGGELVLDDPPPSRSNTQIERTSSAISQEGQDASAATG